MDVGLITYILKNLLIEVQRPVYLDRCKAGIIKTRTVLLGLIPPAGLNK